MSWQRSAAFHRPKVATVKSRAAWMDPMPVPRVHVAIRGRQAQPAGAGSGNGRPLPARPAISAASISQRPPLLRDGYAAIVVRSVSS
jgi:hypothetical protein